MDRVQVLLSTMNRDDDWLEQTKSLYEFCFIVNQTSISTKRDSSWVSINETGLSKSRNLAISNATCELLLVSDDDVIHLQSYDKTISKAFEETNADVICFKIITPSGSDYKKYPNSRRILGKLGVLKVSSVEIAFRNEVIRKNGIKFNENYGLGTNIPGGEENLFLLECLRKGLKIVFEPEIIGIHPELSSNKLFDRKYYYNKGQLFRELYSTPLFPLIFVVKKILKCSSLTEGIISFKMFIKGYYSDRFS